MLNLFSVAEKQDIPVFYFSLPACKSISLFDNGSFFIGLDNSAPITFIEEQTHLGHELGHCLTGSFYNRYSEFDLKARHERRADIWAIKTMVPAALLVDLLKSGLSVYEISETLSVTEEYIIKAYFYYKDHGVSFSSEAV